VTPDQREVCRLSPRDDVAVESAGRNPFLCACLCAHCGSTPIRTITARLSLSPSSFTRCPVGSPCGSRSLTPLVYGAGRTTGLPRSADITEWSRPHLCAGGSTSAPGEFGAPGPGHLPFWPKREQLALVLCDDACDASPGLTIPLHPGSRSPAAGDRSYGSRLGCPHWR
jgi:hypothetical protein